MAAISEAAHLLKRHLHHLKLDKDNVPKIILNNDSENQDLDNQEGKPSKREPDEAESVYRTPRGSRPGSIHNERRKEQRYRAPSPNSRNRKLNLAVSILTASTEDLASINSAISATSLRVPLRVMEEDECDQDIQEVWFPGGYADIGGGWKLSKGEIWPLSHAPLFWMVQEAQRAGLQFDPKKLKQFECCEKYVGQVSPIREHKEPTWTACQEAEGHVAKEDGPNPISIKVPDN